MYRVHPNHNEIAHRVCIILRPCETRFQGKFCVRLAVPEDVAVCCCSYCVAAKALQML